MKRVTINLMCILLFLIIALPAHGQTLLQRPQPPRLVNDFAGILSSSDVERLEQKLVAFNDSTSTQIAIVIVNDLQGYDRSDFAIKVASDWGLGQKGLNSGVLVLIKPKTQDSNGLAFITTGYGIEGIIPDLTCADIVDREMIPKFRKGDYYGGIDAGTNVIMALASKEFTAADYKGKGVSPKAAIPGGLIFFIIIFIIIVISAGNSNNRNMSHRGTSAGLPFWLLMGSLGGGSNSGSWGGSGGGGFSGGGGGFGGFGGGGFGGGGAGGSW
jgi:uncharacterized protein